jgi:hypothetical protein
MLAINGELNEHQRRFLSVLLKHFEQLKLNLKEVEAEITSEIQKFEHQI